jgi:hypothetical protein
LQQSGISRTATPINLVPLRQSYALVEAALKFTHWIHPVVHAPTYLEEHRRWLHGLVDGTTVVQDQYLALCKAGFFFAYR